MTRISTLLRRSRGEGGYSLVEMLTVLLIMGVVMGGLETLFVRASNAEVDMNARFQAQTDIRLALDKFRRDAHTACAVTPTSGSASSVYFTFRTATTSLSGAQATNGGSITVVSTTGFPSSGTLTVNGSPAVTLTYTGKTATTFTGLSGGTSTVQPTGTAVLASTTCSASAFFVTWCTRQVGSSTTRFAFYRVNQSQTCGTSGGTKYADYFTPTTGAATCGTPTALCVFTPTAQTATSLAQVHIDFAANPKPRRTVDTYEVAEDIVLRNSCRVSGACTT